MSKIHAEKYIVTLYSFIINWVFKYLRGIRVSAIPTNNCFPIIGWENNVPAQLKMQLKRGIKDQYNEPGSSARS